MMDFLKKIKLKRIVLIYPQLFYCMILLCFISLTGCTKLVEVPGPIGSVNSGNVYTNDGYAIAAVTGIYTSVSNSGVTAGLSAISLFPGLSADEFTLASPTSNTTYLYFYRNQLTAANVAGGGDAWSRLYELIAKTNNGIEGLSNNSALTPAVGQQLLGEVKFMRALCYFYLAALYDDVPLVVSSDYKVNALLPRTPKSQIYDQIITDLKSAENLLSNQYLDGSLLNPTSERVRPTKWAASALLARAYLFSGNWSEAEKESSLCINYKTLFNLSPLNSTFLKNSDEAIWQLQPVNAGQNTSDGFFFTLPSGGPNFSHPVYLNNLLIKSFEPGDQRLTNWVNSVKTMVNNVTTTYYYPFKYKVSARNLAVTEYEMVLRLGEQYLIRAESRANQNNFTGSAADLNMIRTRAGLSNTTATDQTSLLKAIWHERQVELFSEWGHRWIDLRRTGTIDAVMTSASIEKGATWDTNQKLYPVPLNDMNRDPNLIQNPGY